MKIRAAVLVAPGRYEVQTFDRPKLEDGALLMRVELSGICGTDKHTYQGETKQYAGTESETDTPFPIIQGHENVGIIEELSTAVEESGDFYQAPVKVGDRIVMCPDMICGKCYYCTHIQGYSWCSKSQCYGNSFTSAQWPHLLGGWAEYMYFKPGTFFYKVPENISPKVAVLAELMACAASLDKLKGVNEDENTGIQIVRRAIEEPLRQICANCGIEGSIVVQKVKEGKDDFGYNARIDEYQNLIKSGVIDPVKVTRLALENAASISGLLLTTECVIADIEEPAPAGGGGMPGGMPGMM